MIEFEGVYKSYQHGVRAHHVLFDLNMTIDHHEFVAILGRSGSGKSTTMNILGLLDTPTQGIYRLNGQDVGRLTVDAKALLRNQAIGFVFQQFLLLPRMSVLENVALPLLYRGLPAHVATTKAYAMLARVHMDSFADVLPITLSGGQQQRVAIARALVGEPALVLADEPTGALDSDNGAHVMDVLKTLNQEHGVTVVMITHDVDLAQIATRRIDIADGRLVEVA